MAILTSIIPKKIFSVAAYKKQLIQLLPRGALWKNLSATTKLFFEAIAVEFDRVDTQIVNLRREAVPGLSTAAQLLPDWEEEAGIVPGPSDSEALRQSRVHTALNTTYGNPTKQFFIDYALSAWNMVITVAAHGPFVPFRSGVGVSGDHLEAETAVFTWVITVVSDPNSSVNEMITKFLALKPAHTTFIVSGVEYIN
jgi:uncharacterized protein YmfQ (DUF2313 family)